MPFSALIAMAALATALLPMFGMVIGLETWMALPLALLGIGFGFVDDSGTGRSLNLAAGVIALGLLAHDRMLI